MAKKASESEVIRKKIAKFCKTPRTLEDIKEKFSMGGISVSAYLNWMWCNGICHIDGKGKKRTYTTRTGVTAKMFK